MLDGVWVVRTGSIEKFLEMNFGRAGLALEIAFGSFYVLLARVTSSLTTAAVAGYYGDVMGLPLLPLIATLTAYPRALDGGCGSATISDRCGVAYNEGGQNRLLTRSVSSSSLVVFGC
jgi:hypothetical protein